MSYTWPDTLPAPHGDSYSLQEQPSVVRSSMQSGPAKVRSRFTSTVRQMSCRYFLTDTQKQVLQGFYAQVGGAMAFAWTTPDTGETVQARFIDSPKYTLHHYVYYFADVLVEVLP